ncbi:MAG: two-component sensor histidine kinase [marine bacterium B5-7]|nr:MAG: two-component sensor histidine kinase [marine bacterium B5-7]
MFSGGVTSGRAFRDAFIHGAVFLVVLVLVTAGIYQIVQKAMIGEMQNLITEEVMLLKEIESSDGLDAIANIGFLNARIKTSSTHIFALFGPNGKKLAGNLKQPPPHAGWMRMVFHGLLPEPYGDYLVESNRLASGATLVIGRSTAPIQRVLRIIVFTTGVAALIVFLLRIVLAYMTSRKTLLRLARIVQTLEAVAAGDSSARIPLDGSGEQIERASSLMNLQLDRLSESMQMNRYTMQAIAHDLRSPLNRASILLQDIQRMLADNDLLREKVETAASQLVGLADIFDATLRISKLRSETGTDTFQVISAADIIEETVEAYAPVAEDAGYHLVMDLSDEGSSTILGDQRMLKQLFANLIENALRHCPQGSQIKLVVSGDENCETIVTVSDNGPGIPLEKRKDVLEPFHRLNRNRSTPGTGLGLALVAAIAERHSATLELDDNQPGLVVRLRFNSVPQTVT